METACSVLRFHYFTLGALFVVLGAWYDEEKAAKLVNSTSQWPWQADDQTPLNRWPTLACGIAMMALMGGSHIFRKRWTGWFSTRLHSAAKAHLAGALARLFAPAYAEKDLVQQALQCVFPFCVFTLSETESDGEVVAWQTAGSALTNNAESNSAVLKGFRPCLGVKHGAADFFVVCSAALKSSDGLAESLRATHQRFRKEHGQ